MIDAFADMLLRGNSMQQAPDQRPTVGLPGLLGVGTAVDTGNKVFDILGKPKHKGIFGLSGTPRDILGMIGDALLVGGGADPIYSAARKNEKIGDAMLWNDLDPMTAGQKLMGIDPKIGQEHIDNYQRAQAERAKLGQAQYNADRTYQHNVNKESNARFDKIAPSVYGMLAGADEKTYPSIRAKALAVSKKYGIDLPVELPETWDESLKTTYGQLAINPATRAQIDASNRRSAASLELSKRGLNLREDEAGERKKIGEYVGEDGKNYIMWDDGTETVSQTKVRETGKGRSRPGGGKERKVYGGVTYEFQGGDRTNKNSWKPVS